MMNKIKDRQDAWTDANDLLLAETVLRHVREGSTQLNAFEEVGDALNRTSAACGFRWNAVVRHQYEQALSLAKKYRKDKARLSGGEQAKKKLLYTPPTPALDETLQHMAEIAPEVHIDTEDFHIDLPFTDIEEETVSQVVSQQPVIQQPSMQQQESILTNYVTPSFKTTSLSMSDVIRFLQQYQNVDLTISNLKRDIERLQRENHAIKSRNHELETQVSKLENNTHMIQEDYETLIKIMNRARKIVVLEDEEEVHAPSFRMDRNGNLERIAE